MNKQINSDIIAAAFDSVYKFNDISKQFEGDKRAGVDLSIDLIFEELVETISAMDEGMSDYPNSDKLDAEIELLDGAADVFVVVMGLLQKLQNVGFDVEKALIRVCENNLSKFPKSIPPNDFNWYEQQKWTPVYNDKYSCFVLKDENGKTKKPIDFVPVTLADLVPKDFFLGV